MIFGADQFRRVAEQADAVIAWGLPDLTDLDGFNRPVIMVSHGYCRWTADCIAHADPYVTHYAAVSERALTVCPGHKPRTVIQNGINPDRCTARHSRPALRKLFGIRDNDKIIAFAGRYIHEKGPLAPVWAAKELGPPWRPLLIGDGPYRDAYWKQARDYDPTTILLPPINQIGDLLAAIDCLCVASINEGWCLMLAESWFAFTPAISTPVGVTDILPTHLRNACTFPEAYTPAILADAVRRTQTKTAYDQRIELHKIINDNYLDIHMTNRWMNYLDSILK